MSIYVYLSIYLSYYIYVYIVFIVYCLEWSKDEV